MRWESLFLYCALFLLFMILILFLGGNLYNLLHSDLQISWPIRYRIACDVARALKYLHSVTPPLVHRDVRSPNVLLTCTDISREARLALTIVSPFLCTNRNPIGLACSRKALRLWSHAHEHGLYRVRFVTFRHHFYICSLRDLSALGA